MTRVLQADFWTIWTIPCSRSDYEWRRHEIEADLQDLSVSGELAELLARCADGDRSAFRRLYDMQSSRLYGAALRITRQSALAADAVHDALLQVWQNAARFDPARGNGEAWLLSLVRYRALDIARRSTRETTVAEVPEQIDEDPDPLARLQSSAEATELHRCLMTLEPDRRQLLTLAFVEGLTHTDLSDRLSLPLGTVKSWIRRALASLKRCLEA
jgi:RNA polymerase sigma-70 factor (ECF subfamily)